MTPSAWDFRNKLMATLNVAKYSGEAYVDVDSGSLHAELGGDPDSVHKLAICHEIMKKIMRPGDLILKEEQNDRGPTMQIRYHLKGNRAN